MLNDSCSLDVLRTTVLKSTEKLYWLKYEYYIAELKYLAKNILEYKKKHTLLDEIKILICSHLKI